MLVVGLLGFAACGTDPAATPATIPFQTSAPASSAAPTSTTDATTTSASPPTSAVTTTAVEVVEGFNPPCVESTRDDPHFRFVDEAALDTFGPLAGEPALRVTLPLGRSNEAPELQAPGVSAARIPGGVLLAVGASSYGDFDGAILSAVDADGESHWVRCFDDRIYSTSVAPASSAPTKALVGFGVSQNNAPPVVDWRIVSLDDGAVVGELSDLFAAQGVDPALQSIDFPIAVSPTSIVFGPLGGTIIDTTRDHLLRVDLQTWSAEVVPLPEQSAGGEFFRQRFQYADSGDLVLMGDGLFQDADSVVTAYHGGQWTQDKATLRGAYGIRADFGAPGEGLVGFDALGQELWRDDNVSPTGNEGFRLATSGAVTVISGCLSPPGPNGCVEYSLVGIETETGTILWQIPGLRGVSAIGDGFALITGPETITADGTTNQGPWMLIDTSTGEMVDSTQQWLAPETFRQECCGGGEFVWVGRDGGVVTAVNGEHLAIWYPATAGLTTNELNIP